MAFHHFMPSRILDGFCFLTGMGAAARWKSGMAARASAFFSERSSDLAGFVYGRRAVADAAGEDDMDDMDDDGGGHSKGLGDVDGNRSDGDSSEDSDNDFFRLKQRSDRSEKARTGSLEAIDGEAARSLCTGSGADMMPLAEHRADLRPSCRCRCGWRQLRGHDCRCMSSCEELHELEATAFCHLRRRDCRAVTDSSLKFLLMTVDNES